MDDTLLDKLMNVALFVLLQLEIIVLVICAVSLYYTY